VRTEIIAEEARTITAPSPLPKTAGGTAKLPETDTYSG
jgi:hypothetical protein